MLNEGSNQAVLGPQSIEFLPETIVCTTQVSTSTMRRDIISDIQEDEQYIFLYISSTGALIIPKNVFASDAEQRLFLQYIRNS
jgi:hypothetical protein